jgi:hypothetical protein
MSRTGCGRLGLSIVRGTQLIAAAGALTAVPLGEIVRVGIPGGTIREAERVFQKSDPEFEFPHLPVEIRVGDEAHIMFIAGREFSSTTCGWNTDSTGVGLVSTNASRFRSSAVVPIPPRSRQPSSWTQM